MGQKVNPIGLRTALNHNWESRWFADKKNAGRTLFGDWLQEDLKIRAKLSQAVIDILRRNGVLDGINETDQLTFNF